MRALSDGDVERETDLRRRVGEALQEVASSHGPIHRIDVGGGQPDEVRGDVQVTGQPIENAYVMDAGSAVLDA